MLLSGDINFAKYIILIIIICSGILFYNLIFDEILNQVYREQSQELFKGG